MLTCRMEQMPCFLKAVVGFGYCLGGMFRFVYSLSAPGQGRVLSNLICLPAASLMVLRTTPVTLEVPVQVVDRGDNLT